MQAQEEAAHLKEIIRLKDKEIANLTLMQANRDEEVQMHCIARDKEKDMTINELKIHLVGSNLILHHVDIYAWVSGSF